MIELGSPFSIKWESTSEAKPGKMLIVLAKITDKDSLVFSYSESKRTFYKSH
jgi:hypothetical protein